MLEKSGLEMIAFSWGLMVCGLPKADFQFNGQKHITKKRATTLLLAFRENGLQASAENTTHMFLCHEKNAGQYHNTIRKT
jgi:hypothetical protein